MQFVMNRLLEVSKPDDILPQYRNTPISKLIEYHNLNYEFKEYENAELLIGMCMDHRKHLTIPSNFAYIIRTGGANLRHSEFKVSFALSVGGVRSIVLIGHTNCGMVNLFSKKEPFINGLIETGWDKSKAQEHFNHFAPLFEIENEVDFVLSEAVRLRRKYPNILIAPLLYKVEDNLLYFIQEDE